MSTRRSKSCPPILDRPTQRARKRLLRDQRRARKLCRDASPSAKILFGVVDHSHSGKPPPGQPVCAQQSAPPTYEQQPAPTPPPVQPVYAQPAPPMYEPQAAPAPPPGQPPPTYEPQPVPAPPPGQPVQPAPPTYEPQPVPAVPHWPRTRLCPGSLTDDLSMATTCQCRQADRAYVLARAWRLA